MLEFAGVTIGYRTTPIVNDFDLKIKSGQKVAIVGPSGSGKSTILRALWNEADIINGQIVNSFESQSVVFQHNGLFEWLTARENLQITAPHSSNHVIEEMAKQFKISDVLDKYCSQISGGQQQRIQIMRGLLTSSQLLIMDEPTSSLDMVNKSFFSQLLMENIYEQTAVLLVTHDLEEALLIADHIIVINQGRVIESVDNVAADQRIRNSQSFDERLAKLREVILNENN